MAADRTSFTVAAVPAEKPDHVVIAVLIDGRLAREWEIGADTAAGLADDLQRAVARIQETSRT